MKQLIILLAACLLQSIAFGQNVKIKKGKASVNKVPYCIIDIDRKIASSYTIKTLDGTELFFVKRAYVTSVDSWSRTYFVVTRLDGTEEKFEIDFAYKMKDFLVKSFYNNGVIKDNAINEDGFKKFKLKYKGDFKAQYEAEAERVAQSKPDVVVVQGEGSEAETAELTERDRTGQIFIMGKTIKQSSVVIGKYEKSTDAREGSIYDNYKIYNDKGRLIAQIEQEQFSKTATYITLKDNRKHSIEVKTLLDSDLIEAIIKELIDYMYI